MMKRNRSTALPAAMIFLTWTMVLLAGCEINKPEMPTFETTVSIPLGTERLEVIDLVEDEEFLVVGNDSSLGFFIQGDPDTVAFEFDLNVEIPAQSTQQGMGNFDLPSVSPMAYAFEMGEIWPPAAGVNNQPVMVPAFPIDIASEGQNLSGIDSAILASGAATLTVTNGLPVPVSANGGPQQMVVHLLDPTTGIAFTTFTFPEIGPGQMSMQMSNLAGVNLPGEIAVAVTGGSPGSAGTLVNVTGSAALEITATFNGLVVSSATAAVGSHTFQTDFDTDLPDDYAVTRALISSGTVTLVLSNELPISCETQVTWPNLVNIDGNPMIEEFDLGPGQSLSRELDFSGWTLQATDEPLTTLAAELVIITTGSGGLPVTMSAGDGLTADLSPGSLTFGSVTGLVPAYEVQVDPIEEAIDLPDELEGLELTAAAMVVRLTNSSGLAGDLDLTLTGTSASGQVRTLEVQQTIAAAEGRAPNITSILLDQDNSTIVDFLNNLPETMALNGSIQVGGDGSIGTINGDDFAAVSWEISAPLEVVILGSNITTDPVDIDLDQNVREMIQDHALSAYIQTEILNSFPFGVELSILVGTDPGTLESDPLLTIGPVVVDGAQLDPFTHTVLTPVTSRPVVTLTQQQAEIFATPGLITAVAVVLPSTNGQPVRMMATDFLEVKGIVQMDVLVNDQW